MVMDLRCVVLGFDRHRQVQQRPDHGACRRRRGSVVGGVVGWHGRPSTRGGVDSHVSRAMTDTSRSASRSHDGRRGQHEVIGVRCARDAGLGTMHPSPCMELETPNVRATSAVLDRIDTIESSAPPGAPSHGVRPVVAVVAAAIVGLSGLRGADYPAHFVRALTWERDGLRCGATCGTPVIRR